MMTTMTPTVKQLLIITVLFYIGSHLVPNAYTLFSLYYAESPNFRWWQPITYMFMHARYPDILHIVMNMFGLVMFGSTLEHFWGAKKFIFFYITCGLGAALVHMGVNYYEVHQGVDALRSIGVGSNEIQSLLLNGEYNTAWLSQVPLSTLEKAHFSYIVPTVGASGAIYGLLVAFAFMFPNAELMLMFIPVPIKAKYFVPALVAIDLFSGASGRSLFGSGGVAHFAHVGGALFGFILMWMWRNKKYNFNRWN